jgi:translation initiation factor 1A
MAKNKFGGSGAKKTASKNANQTARQIPFREDLQDYALVETLLGSGHVKLKCLTDNTERLGTICGRMYKKVWINKDDVVLVSIREYQDNRCDIIFKYTTDEVKTLKKYGEIKETKNQNNDDDIIEFGDDEVNFDIDDI